MTSQGADDYGLIISHVGDTETNFHCIVMLTKTPASMYHMSYLSIIVISLQSAASHN